MIIFHLPLLSNIRCVKLTSSKNRAHLFLGRENGPPAQLFMIIISKLAKHSKQLHSETTPYFLFCYLTLKTDLGVLGCFETPQAT